MAETALRSLAKAYAKKNLEHAPYRAARAKFINGVLSGEAELTVNEYPSLIRPKRDEALEATVRRSGEKKTPLTGDTKERSPAPQPQLQAQPQQQANNKTLLAALVVVVIIIVAVVVYAVTRSMEQSPASVPTSQTASPTPAQPNAAQLLARDLLKQDDWASNTSLDAFMKKWQALPVDIRTKAIGTLELNQLTTAIYRQLIKERALAGIGNGDVARLKEQRLVEFAHNIGIRDPKIAISE